MSELQLKLHNMDGVALQHMGRYSQVQIFSGDRVTALYIHGKSWIDPAQTEAVYRGSPITACRRASRASGSGPEHFSTPRLTAGAIAPRMRALMTLTTSTFQFTHAFAAPPRARDRDHLIC